MQALSSLFENSLLITEFPGKFGETKSNNLVNIDDDDADTIKDFVDDIGSEEEMFLNEGRKSSRDVDYDTDLDMDFEGIP